MAARKAVVVSIDVPENEENTQDLGNRIASTVSKALLSMISVPILADQRWNTPSLVGSSTSTTMTSKGSSAPQHADTNGYTSELVRLLQKRDIYKTMASHAGRVTKISIIAATTKARDDNDGSSTIDASSKRRTSMFSDYDETLHKRFADIKVEHDSLLSKIDSAESRYNEDRQAAESELKSCQDRKHSISLQKADLLRQIQLLEEEETTLSEKETKIENTLNGMSSKLQAEKEDIEKRLEGPKKVMKLARACRGLEDILLSFQKSLADSSSQVTANGTSGNKIINDTEKSVADFYAAMQSYFQVEAQCVDALKIRSSSMSTNLSNIVRYGIVA